MFTTSGRSCSASALFRSHLLIEIEIRRCRGRIYALDALHIHLHFLRPAADGSRAWIDALRPYLPDKGLVETIKFYKACPHAMVRSSRFLRYLWNLAKFLPAALPLVGAWRRPHRRAEDGGEVALDGDGRSYMSIRLIARHIERLCILGGLLSEQGPFHPGPRPGALGIMSFSSRGHVHEAGAVSRRGDRCVGGR